MSQAKKLERKLLAFEHEWHGTPYRYGGMNKQGLDCSAFVLLAYKALFGKSLPRTTTQQARLGESITKNRLQTGDLVFFKTGRTSHHVGIYLSKTQFMHASYSRGVMISSLNNSYWQQHYWLSRSLMHSQ